MATEQEPAQEVVPTESIKPASPITLPGYYPEVANPDGSRSNVVMARMSDADDNHYAVPTMWDGELHSGVQAWSRARQLGLENFPQGSPEDVDWWIEQNHGNIIGSSEEPEIDVDLVPNTPERVQAAKTLRERLRAWNPELAQRITENYQRAAEDAADESLPQAQRLAAKMGMNQLLQIARKHEQSDDYIAWKEDGMRDALRKASAILEGSVQPLPKDLNEMRGDKLRAFHRSYMALSQNAYHARSTVSQTQEHINSLFTAPGVTFGSDDDDDNKDKIEWDAMNGMGNHLSAPEDVNKWSHDLLRRAYALTENEYTKEEKRELQTSLEKIREQAAKVQEETQARIREVSRYGGSVQRALIANPYGFNGYIVDDMLRAEVKDNLLAIDETIADKMLEEHDIPKEDTLNRILEGMSESGDYLASPEFIKAFMTYALAQGWEIPIELLPPGPEDLPFGGFAERTGQLEFKN